jgi:hypothetical protein
MGVLPGSDIEYEVPRDGRFLWYDKSVAPMRKADKF